jgi:hypothetical protein
MPPLASQVSPVLSVVYATQPTEYSADGSLACPRAPAEAAGTPIACAALSQANNSYLDPGTPQ